MKYIFIKNFCDKFLAILALIFLFPLFLVIIISSYFILGRPIFFIQKRPGFKGKIFKLIKFRTMKQAKNNQINPKEDRIRETKYGNFLRSISLDELPEIINIIKGEMSFVGPRPLLEEYLDLYSADELKRHNVKPGITGYAQINGRNSISWEKKFEYDLWYIKNLSFANDIKIIFTTIKKVIQRTNINQSENISMPKFKGTLKKK